MHTIVVEKERGFREICWQAVVRLQCWMNSRRERLRHVLDLSTYLLDDRCAKWGQIFALRGRYCGNKHANQAWSAVAP